MDKELQNIFNQNLYGFKVDRTFVRKIREIRLHWINRTYTHTDFLASNLLGVHPIRFTTADEEMLYMLFDIDSKSLTKDLHALDDINKDFKVTSNVYYLLIVYLISQSTNSKLSTRDQESVVTDLFNLMSYKMLSSTYSHYYSYDVEHDIAVITHEHLSMRFLLKKLGNWQAVINYRAKDVLSDGLHYDRLKKLEVTGLVYVISDTKTKFNSIIQEIHSVMVEVVEGNQVRTSRSLTSTDTEGVDVVVDIDNVHTKYYQFLRSIVFKESELIHRELLEVSIEIFKNITVKDAEQTLKLIAEISLTENDMLDELLEIILTANIEYLYVSKLNPPYAKYTLDIIKHLKGYWSSSKVTDKNVIKAKKMMQSIVKRSTSRRTNWLVVSISNTLIIYLFVRAVLGVSQK